MNLFRKYLIVANRWFTTYAEYVMFKTSKHGRVLFIFFTSLMVCLITVPLTLGVIGLLIILLS